MLRSFEWFYMLERQPESTIHSFDSTFLAELEEAARSLRLGCFLNIIVEDVDLAT